MNEQAKKTFSKLGLALFLMVIIINVVQMIIVMILNVISPNLMQTSTGIWLTTGISTYLIALPFVFLFLKKIPTIQQMQMTQSEPELQKVNAKFVLKITIIMFGAMYIGNFIGVIVTSIIGLFKNDIVINPLEAAVGTNPLEIGMSIVFGCILSPIVEEVIFRKILLDRARVYGNRLGIIFTALMFGLFHMNFSQLFYATALGILLAYVTMRTGNIKLACLLHIVINLFGMIIMPGIVGVYSGGEISIVRTLITGLLIIGFIIGGIVVFALNFTKAKFPDEPRPMESVVSLKAVYVNVGMILFFVISGGLILFTTLMPVG